MVRAVFFDAAGTLFDVVEPVGRIYARLARRFGMEADDQAVEQGFRKAFLQAPALAFGRRRPAAELRRLEREWWWRVVAETFAGLGSFGDFERYFDALFELFGQPANFRLAAEAEPTLRRLKQRGLLLGVISNFDFRLYEIMRGLGIAGYFDSVTISSEAGFAKPAAEIFAVALAKHGLSAAESIHVGDSAVHDAGGAAAAGMRALLVGRERVGAPLPAGALWVPTLEAVAEAIGW